MFNKFFTLSVSAFIALVFTAMSFGQAVIFEDNFDSYTAGMQLACQNPTDWTTWSGAPCGAEDMFVSNNFAFSGANSFVTSSNQDLIKPLGTLTTGLWTIEFMIYIPTGQWGYFNTLAVSPLNGAPNWGMQVYFEAAGAARIDAGGANSATWTYLYDTWQSVVVVVDLDSDLAELWFDGVLIHSWQWTLGTFGAGSPLQLDANNFFGATQSDEMYVDDYAITDITVPTGIEIEVNSPLTFGLEQNYPNPFNPSTNIKYRISETGSVKLAIYNMLGEEVAVLVDGIVQAGFYEVTFDASNFPSGAYFYRLQSDNLNQVKKMLLMK